MMRMIQAKQKLMELAQGDCHSIAYRVDDDGRGVASQNCRVYTRKHGHFEASNWEDALNALESTIIGAPKLTEGLPVSQPPPDSSEPKTFTA